MCSSFGWDHPRLRGEQTTISIIISIIVGSPPLARGTAITYPTGRKEYGITPACAGNRCNLLNKCNLMRDHPRLRGEQLITGNGTCPRSGSPPLARGTVPDAKCILSGQGITPACAGNRIQKLDDITAAEDHPRLRGEQFGADLKKCIGWGSPPLARGTVIRDVVA